MPGQTKTRLCPPLSAEQAALLYECFLRDTLDVARAVPGITRHIAYLPHNESDFFGNLRLISISYHRSAQAWATASTTR